jgi:hypothetical protein
LNKCLSGRDAPLWDGARRYWSIGETHGVIKDLLVLYVAIDYDPSAFASFSKFCIAHMLPFLGACKSPREVPDTAIDLA